MKASELKELEKRALQNNSIAKLFTNGKLARTFDSNEEAVAYLKNIAFKTNGIWEEADGEIVVTTPNENIHKLILIKNSTEG